MTSIVHGADYIRTAADAVRARRMCRLARVAERNARRQGQIEAANKLKAQAERWRKARDRYVRARNAFERVDIRTTFGSGTEQQAAEIEKFQTTGDLYDAAANMWGRSADSLRMAQEEDINATDAQSARDEQCARENAEAMRRLADAWEKAAMAFDEAIGRWRVASTPEYVPNLPPIYDERAQREAERAIAKAKRLWEAAALLLEADEARRAAKQAEVDEDRVLEGLFDLVRQELEKAASAWSAAAESAGAGRLREQRAHEERARTHRSTAEALEDALEDADADRTSGQPSGDGHHEQSVGMFRQAAEAWATVAERMDALDDSTYPSRILALMAGADALRAAFDADREGAEATADAWSAAAGYWQAIFETPTPSLSDFEVLGQAAQKWERASAALAGASDMADTYLAAAQKLPPARQLLERTGIC